MRFLRVLFDPDNESWVYLVLGVLLGALLVVLYVNLFMT